MVVFHPEDLEPVFRIAFATIRIQILALDLVDILEWPLDRRERALEAFRESVRQKLLIQPMSLREASEVAKRSITAEFKRTDLPGARSNRVGRLKAYGNAIVPQLAAVFVREFMASVYESGVLR